MYITDLRLSEDVYNKIFVEQGYDLKIDKSKLIKDYPHGFIDSKAMKPEDFNIIGLGNFFKDISMDYIEWSMEIIDTCIDSILLMIQINDLELFQSFSDYLENNSENNYLDYEVVVDAIINYRQQFLDKFVN